MRINTRMRGFTLIELMISTTLSLVVLGVVLSLYANSQNSYRTQSLNRQIQENGRFALQIMSEDLRMAKYLGTNMMLTDIDTTEPATLIYGCGAAGWASNISQPIFASNNTNPYSTNCIAAANYKSNTDVLVVRHVNSQPVPTSTIKKNHLYLYTSLMTGSLFRADNDGAVDSGPIADVIELPVGTYKLSTNAYYIRPCSDTGNNGVCGDADDDTIPTLVRETLSANDTITEPLVEFVENMQIRFGIDTASDFTIDRYVNADNVTDWSKVMSVRIYVLTRAPRPVTGYDNANTYVVGDVNVTPADNYYRKLFSETLFLRNPSMDIKI